MISNKPLHPYEQSMLISLLLFENKNTEEILSFFGDAQRDKMIAAQKRFRDLPKNERLTQIVLELRRLLLIEDNSISWIHHSWIDDALEQEPPYLRKLLTGYLKERPSRVGYGDNLHAIPPSYIFACFIESICKSPQKMAIFDPVLMRLQSLKNEAQEVIFGNLGSLCIKALGEVIDKKRLDGFLNQRGLSFSSLLVADLSGNPFSACSVRHYFLKQLVTYRNTHHVSESVYLGLSIIALYLSVFKYQWRRIIALALDKKLGQTLEKKIDEAKVLNLERAHHSLLSNFLLKFLDYAGPSA